MASYYDLHKGKLGAILTQIRLGLSPLRGQMFIYNLTDNPICPNCFDHVETAEHYFLCCVSYTKHQLDLKNKVMLLLHELNVQTKISIDIKKNSDYLSVLTHGVVINLTGASQTVSCHINKLHLDLYLAVTNYLYNTKRFINKDVHA